MDNRYLVPTYYSEPMDYSFGSWLKGNIGNIAQTVGGIALMATGAGAAAGIPMIASGLGGFGSSAVQSSAEKQAEEDQTAMESEQKKQALVQNRMSNIGNNASNVPTFKKGGHLPEGRSTLKEAKEFIAQFPEEMKMGEEVEYEHTGNQKLAQRIAADHVKDYLKMTGTPGYYSAMKQAGISDELNKMEKGGYIERKNGKIYVNPNKKKMYDKFAKKYNLGGKLDNIPMLSFFPDGGKMNPIYPREYGKTYLIEDPSGTYQKEQGYGVPENVKAVAGKVRPGAQVEPTYMKDKYGWQEYKDRADLPPAGYMNPADSSYTYRKYYQTAHGKDTVSYEPGTRADVANAMYRILDSTAVDAGGQGRYVPNDLKKVQGINAYRQQTGAPSYRPFAEGGKLDKDILTEYKGGGTHEQNPHGGIPVGQKARVEEGEYRFDDPDSGESYIFSNRF